jgi:hypothetical protein
MKGKRLILLGLVMVLGCVVLMVALPALAAFRQVGRTIPLILSSELLPTALISAFAMSIHLSCKSNPWRFIQ